MIWSLSLPNWTDWKTAVRSVFDRHVVYSITNTIEVPRTSFSTRVEFDQVVRILAPNSKIRFQLLNECDRWISLIGEFLANGASSQHFPAQNPNWVKIRLQDFAREIFVLYNSTIGQLRIRPETPEALSREWNTDSEICPDFWRTPI